MLPDSLESRNKVPDFEEFVLFVEKLARIAGNTWFGKQLFTVSPEQGRPISGKSHPSKRSMMVTAMAGMQLPVPFNLRILQRNTRYDRM